MTGKTGSAFTITGKSGSGVITASQLETFGLNQPLVTSVEISGGDLLVTFSDESQILLDLPDATAIDIPNVNSYDVTVPVSSTNIIDVTHNLNTKDVIIQVLDADTDEEIGVPVVRFLDKVTLDFGDTSGASASKDYKVLIAAKIEFQLDTFSINAWTITVPAGQDQEVDIEHNLTSKDVIVQVFDENDEQIELQIIRYTNKVKLFFGDTSSVASYRVVIAS